MRGEGGSGSVLAVGIAASVALLASVAIPASAALAVRQSVIGAADAAALAGADTAMGVVGGVPCDSAARLAVANGSRLGDCVVDGYIVTVAVSRTFAGFGITATATAGPPSD